MIQFNTCVLKFGEQGEKTGWTYIRIPAELAQELMPLNKKSFRVKGSLDNYHFEGVSLLPLGGGDFMMALNAAVRKSIRKQAGANLRVRLEIDHKPISPSPEFIECLKDEPEAFEFFSKLPRSHQHYFIKWIDSAKTEPTKVKRIATVVNALGKRTGFSEMIRMSSRLS